LFGTQPLKAQYDKIC